MARYFFNIHDGTSIVDTIGSEHKDLLSVRNEAVDTISQRFHNALLRTSDTSSLLMNVTDQDGITVLMLSFSATVQIIMPPIASDTGDKA